MNNQEQTLPLRLATFTFDPLQEDPDLPDEMRAEEAPEVEVTDEPREPVQDPRLGIEVDVDAKDTPGHRVVAIGDSLTHGLQSGAIYNTDLSYPARWAGTSTSVTRATSANCSSHLVHRFEPASQ